MRVTTNALLRNYGYNLNQSLSNLDSARTKVMTKRNFNSIDEDPAGATKAFQLRREMAKNEDYQNNLKTIQGKFDAIEATGIQINTVLKEVNGDVLTAITGTTSLDQRQTIAKGLRETAKAIILNVNTTFGDSFLFGGSSTKEVPFVMGEDGTLTYRGVDVNATDAASQKQLDDLSGETLYLDLGFGLKEETDPVTGETKLIGDSAFNTSSPGINLLGYGNTDTGVSKNIATLLNQMADELEKDPLDQDKFKEMTDQFTISKNEVIDNITKLGTQSKFLENTKTRLEQNHDTLNEKIVSIENVDLAEAITNYSWAQYAYNAALKVGNSILSPSFIDFMN